jgi:hypothetical protein
MLGLRIGGRRVTQYTSQSAFERQMRILDEIERCQMEAFYNVTADQVRTYHEKCAERAEKRAEEQQAKLEKIPAEARDQCNQGQLERYRIDGEQQRALAKAVADVTFGFMVDQHDYLRIAGLEDHVLSNPTLKADGRSPG